METLILGDDPIEYHHIQQIIETDTYVKLSAVAKKRITRAAEYVQKKVESGEIIYGVTTGFGANSDKIIKKEETSELQRNLLLSHACGVGEPFDVQIIKLVIFLRIINFTHGHSGIRLETVERLVFFFNHKIRPVVPCQGSVGASGDLAPLSHIGIALLGEGDVFYEGVQHKTKDILEKFGLAPLQLSYKEGLALNNGTTFITATGLYNIRKTEQLIEISDTVAALTIEVCAGRKEAFDPKPHHIRPHPGQQHTAQKIRYLLEGSTLFGIDCKKIPGKKIATQDSYSLRCIPQVHGATKNTVAHVKQTLMIEVHSVTDNPLIFVEEDQVISAGNFHGQPVALIMDYLKVAVAELGNISERRSAKLVDPHHNEGLPAFLVGSDQDVGLHSGYMIPQYVSASLVSENKVLAHPATVDSIPTSANIEDHVSMGTIAARQAGEIIDNVYKIYAIELLLACQAIDIRKETLTFDRNMGTGTQRIYQEVRNHIPSMKKDRYVAPDIEKVFEIIHRGII